MMSKDNIRATTTTRRPKPIVEKIALNLHKFLPNRSQPQKLHSKPHRSHAHRNCGNRPSFEVWQFAHTPSHPPPLLAER